jgi:hypothetical protein
MEVFVSDIVVRSKVVKAVPMRYPIFCSSCNVEEVCRYLKGTFLRNIDVFLHGYTSSHLSTESSSIFELMDWKAGHFPILSLN